MIGDAVRWGVVMLVATMVPCGVTYAIRLPRVSGPNASGIDPCTLPDLGPSNGWRQSKHWGHYVILTDLSANPPRTISVADGITGHRSGESIRLQIDIRDRTGSRPAYPVAVRMALSGKGGGHLRPAGKGYACQSMWFFWSGNSIRRTPPSLDVVEYTLGSETQIVGGLPVANAPGKTSPLWAATQTITIEFGETDPAQDAQYRDGEVEYSARPEGDSSSLLIPNPFQSVTTEARFFGSNLEPGGQLVYRQASREYIAIRQRGQKSSEIVLFGTTRDSDGSTVSVRQPIVLRRLGTSDIFVGQVILIPDGDSYEVLGGRSPKDSILALPGGASDIVIED